MESDGSIPRIYLAQFKFEKHRKVQIGYLVEVVRQIAREHKVDLQNHSQEQMAIHHEVSRPI